MRIAFITNNYTPYHGGVVQSINAITKELQRQGHTIQIITLDFAKQPNQPADPPWVTRLYCPLKMDVQEKHLALPWRPYAQLKKLLTAFAPDIIHIHHPFLLGPAALRIAKKLDTPTVFTYHTMYEDYAHHVPVPQILSRPAIKQITRSFCKNVSHIIAPSTHIQKMLKSRGVKTASSVIPSPVKESFFNQIPATHTQKEGVLRVLFVSRFAQEKNIPFIVQTILNLKNETNISFTLVGYGPLFEQTKKELLLKHQLTQPYIQFFHHPHEKTLAQLYRTADLFLFSSHSDTQGIVLAEAMAGATPVVTTYGPGQNDIVKEGENGFFTQTPREMARYIVKLRNERALLENLSRNARKTAQRYHPAYVVTTIVSIYKKLVEKSVNQGPCTKCAPKRTKTITKNRSI